MVSNKSKRLIFIHIPKCAGTSMLRIFQKIYGEESVHNGSIRFNWNLANEINLDLEHWKKY